MPDIDPADLPERWPKTDEDLAAAAALLPAIPDDAEHQVGDDLRDLDLRGVAVEPPPYDPAEYDQPAGRLAAGGEAGPGGVRLVGEAGAEQHQVPPGGQVR